MRLDDGIKFVRVRRVRAYKRLTIETGMKLTQKRRWSWSEIRFLFPLKKHTRVARKNKFHKQDTTKLEAVETRIIHEVKPKRKLIGIVWNLEKNKYFNLCQFCSSSPVCCLLFVPSIGKKRSRRRVRNEKKWERRGTKTNVRSNQM